MKSWLSSALRVWRLDPNSNAIPGHVYHDIVGWLDARNLSSHTYKKALAEKVCGIDQNFLPAGESLRVMNSWTVAAEFTTRPQQNAEAWVYRIHREEQQWGILVDERIPNKTLFQPSSHSHSDWDEGIIPLDGLYWVKIGDWERKFAPGEAALIPGGIGHDSGIATNLAGTWSLVILLHHSLSGFTGVVPGGVKLPSGCLSWLKGALRFLRQEQNVQGFLPLSILPEFIRAIAVAERLPRDKSHPDPIVTDIIRALEQPDTPSLATIARSVGLTSSHFQRRFMQAVGCSPLQYARAWKLDQIAERLDRDSNTPLIDMAIEFGFGDMKHFRSLFRNRFGCTPGAYRKNPPPR